jgi:hypothetical protein
MYVNAPPYFEVNESTDAPHGPIKDQEGFSERIIEFIEWNLNNFSKLDVLCYLVQSDGTVMEATLEEDGYFKSLQKCLEYYSSVEEYEKCNNIKNLIKDYELQ